MRAALEIEEITVSEKVVRRITKGVHLVANRPVKRKCSSCKEEIDHAPENIANRDFRADVQTRFGSPACAWLDRARPPHADLASTMPGAAASGLPGDDPLSVGTTGSGSSYRRKG